MLPFLMVMLMARGREDQETWDEFRLASGLSDAEHSRFQQSYKRHCRRANLGDETTTQQKLAYITEWRRNSARNGGQQAPPQQQNHVKVKQHPCTMVLELLFEYSYHRYHTSQSLSALGNLARDSRIIRSYPPSSPLGCLGTLLVEIFMHLGLNHVACTNRNPSLGVVFQVL